MDSIHVETCLLINMHLFKHFQNMLKKCRNSTVLSKITKIDVCMNTKQMSEIDQPFIIIYILNTYLISSYSF